MFRPKKPLTAVNLGPRYVPSVPGVYIIYLANGSPFYVGRSIVSVRDRLCCHAAGRGSQRVAELLRRGEKLTFEWEEMMSAEQAEAQLIKGLGTRGREFGNLRRETDPADW
jgi:excinuclease UvrABC nuclease subunit